MTADPAGNADLGARAEAELDAALDQIRADHPGITNADIVGHLPEHLRQPFWERAVGRYLEAELAKLDTEETA